MSSAHAEAEYGSWSVEEHPIRIDYSVRVLEEISALAIDGLHRFRHGGEEIGGVLYGHASGRIVQILGYAPLACEHAFGPRFVLSDRDRAAFRMLVEAPGHEPVLAGLATVGWYHSHTRSPICLSPRDIEIHERYFPSQWQVALVLRPESRALSRAGFFVKESDHSIRERTYAEFPVRPYRGEGPDAEKPEPEPEDEDAVAEAQLEFDSDDDDAVRIEEPETEAEGETEAAYVEPEKETRLRPPRARPVKRVAATYVEPQQGTAPAGIVAPDDLPSFARPQARRWKRWALLAIVLCAGGGFGVREYLRFSAAQQPLSLWVSDVGGQLLIEWDRASRPVKRADSGVLEIQDGKESVTIQIDADHLREGGVDYVRHAETVDVKLRIYQPGRGTAEEFIRFVGPPVRRPDDPEMVALKNEVNRLRGELAARDELLARQSEALQNEAQQREAQQKEAQQREAQLKEAQQREAQLREAQQKEARQKNSRQSGSRQGTRRR